MPTLTHTKREPAQLISGPDNQARNLLLTIVVPTYHRGELLAQTLDSINAQGADKSRFSVIVIDNEQEAQNDPTETQSVVAKYIDFCSYYRNAENLGMAGNHNQAVALANSEWVSIIHDDDLFTPHYVETAMELIAKFGDYGMIGFKHASLFDHSGHIEFTNGNDRFRPVCFSEQLTDNYYVVTGMLLKKSVWEQCGGFNPDFYPSFDYNLWTHIALESKAGIFAPKEALTIYRVGQNCSMKVDTTIQTSQSDSAGRATFINHFCTVKRWWWTRFNEAAKGRYIENAIGAFHSDKSPDQIERLRTYKPKNSHLNGVIFFITVKFNATLRRLRGSQKIELQTSKNK